MSLFLGDPSPTVGLKLSTLTYEKSIRSTTTVNGIVDAVGVADIATFVTVQSLYTFSEGFDIRMLAASPVIRYTYKGGDKTLAVNYAGPVQEGVGGIGVRSEVPITSAANIVIPHNDQNFFSTAVHTSGDTTLDNISGLTETGLRGALKLTSIAGKTFTFGPALDDAVKSGFFNNARADGEERLEYWLTAGQLYLSWPNSSQVKP